jgi:hypothetical protein
VSELIAPTSDLAVKEAAAKGLAIVFPADGELQLDIDVADGTCSSMKSESGFHIALPFLRQPNGDQRSTYGNRSHART